MSIFGNIMSSIFGHAKAQTTPAAPGKTLAQRPQRTQHGFRSDALRRGQHGVGSGVLARGQR